MRRRWLIIGTGILIIAVLTVGGFLIVGKWNTPDTPAFQDEFTQQFLVKDAEAPDGFHLFESGTKKYTMLYPEDYYMAEGSYYRKKGVGSEHPDMENVYMRQDRIDPKKNGMIKGVKLFLHPGGNVLVDATLQTILEKMNAPEDTKIREYEDENKTVYYAENIDDYHADDGSIDTYFYFYGFIVHNNSKQALYFELEDTCFNSDSKKCAIDFEKEKKMGLEMMTSVEFK